MATADTAVSDAPVVITGVHTDLGAEELRANLESPAPGEATPGLWIPFVGWISSTGDEQPAIRISDRWSSLRQFRPNVARPDILGAFSHLPAQATPGFSLVFDVVRQPEEFDLWLTATLSDAAIRFALIRGRRRRYEPVPLLPIVPLAVTTLGRTGSTLLMTLLSHHPAIAAFRPISNDSRPFGYWLGAATRLATVSSRLQLVDSTGPTHDWWFGHDPVSVESLLSPSDPVHQTLFGRSVDALLGDAMRNAATVARDLAFVDGRAAPRYAAEKCYPNFVPWMMRELCPDARELFLVRDPRDVFTSMIAFNAKRGFATFGRETVDSDDAFLERFTTDAEVLADAWASRRETAHLVTYEHLVSDPDAALAAIFDYLELDSSPGVIAQIIDEANAALDGPLAAHRTTETVSASTGRWEHDLEPELRSRCAAALAHACAEFGYE